MENFQCLNHEGSTEITDTSCTVSKSSLAESSQVRVFATTSGSRYLIVPPTTLDVEEFEMPSIKVVGSSGDWSTMTFTCEDTGISEMKYELLKQYGSPCSLPDSWSSSSIISSAQSSRTFTVSGSFDDYFVACRAILGSKIGPIDDLIHME